MIHQSHFDFIREPDLRRPLKPERVFFGLLAGEAGGPIVACRERLMREQRIFGSRIVEERLHLGLSFLGDFKRIPSKVPYGAGLAADRVAMPPFEVVLDHAVTFEGGRPGRYATVLLAKSDALHDLGGSLFHELGLQGMKASLLILPHVTLFYSPRRIRPTRIKPIRLWIDRFYLIHSECGLGRYTMLGCWFLGGAPTAPVHAVTPPLAFGSMAA